MNFVVFFLSIGNAFVKFGMLFNVSATQRIYLRVSLCVYTYFCDVVVNSYLHFLSGFVHIFVFCLANVFTLWKLGELSRTFLPCYNDRFFLF